MRRSLPPRPTHEGGADVHAEGARLARQSSRPLSLVEREAPYMFNELKRIFMVTGTCVAVLIVSGGDRAFETLVLMHSPDWLTNLTTSI